MEVVVKSIQELTDEEYRACYAANLGDHGYMQYELHSCRYHGYDGIAVMIWDDELIGWALLTPVRLWGQLAASPWTKKVSKYTVQLWVQPEHRRKGHGTTLMEEVSKLDPRPHVMPYDEVSGKVFSKHNVMVMNVDKAWMP